MLLDRMAIFADALAPLLAPGERMVLLSAVTYMAGDERLTAEPPRVDADTIVDMALGLPTSYLQHVADRWVSGTSLVGWPGCAAQRLATALSGSPDVLLTDQRMLLLTRRDGAFTVVYEAPRESVIAVRRASRFGQAGRVILTLSDGSAVAVVLGLVLTGVARRFVAAWQPIAGTLA